MDLKELFLIISILCSSAAPVIATVSIFKGNFKPQRTTRFLVFFITLVLTASLFANGDRNGIYVALVQLISSTLILVLSIKFGLGGRSKFDLFVFILAILSFIGWQLSNNPTIGLLLSILTDIIAFSPSVIKAYKQPETEEWKFYVTDILSGIFNTLSIKNLTITAAIFPVYVFLLNTLFVLLINRKKIHGILRK